MGPLIVARMLRKQSTHRFCRVVGTYLLLQMQASQVCHNISVTLLQRYRKRWFVANETLQQG